MQNDAPPHAVPLSYAQERQFTHRAGGLPDVALQSAFRIDGPLQVPMFVDALNRVVNRHEALRLRVAEDSLGIPRQWVVAPGTVRDLVRLTAVNARSDEQFGTYAGRVRAVSRNLPWLPSEEPPFRFTLLRRSPELHAFLADFSPLAVDGRSRSIFSADLWATYAAVAAGRPVDPDRPTGDLLATVSRQRAKYDQRSRTVNHDYWARKFRSLHRAGQGPVHADGETTAADCHTRAIALHPAALARIRRELVRTGSSLFQWVASRFAAEVFRRTSRPELATLVPMDTRAPGDRMVMGKFAALFPLLIACSGNPDEILQSVKDEIMTTMRHRHISDDDFRRAGGTAVLTPARGAVHLRSDIHPSEEWEGLPEGLHVTQKAFTGQERFICDGLNLTIEEFADRARLVLDYDPRDHTAADADDFARTLATAVYGSTTSVARPTT